MLPLYAQIPRNTFEQATSAHTGLLFDKFPDGWNETRHYQLADNAKKDFLTSCIKKYTQTELTQNLTIALNRQRDLVKNHLHGESLIVQTNWRFISGLGTAHPYETGFIWHRTLSVPYLSGSSVKGLMRAWAEQWGGLAEQQEITRLFGTGEEKTENQQDHCGALIIFDALPTKPPKLELDILNPHYSEYYKDPVHNPPADYLSPIPVFFLTVAAEQEFEFFLAPRKNSQSKTVTEDIKTAKKLLSDALGFLGAGGKTAVGYGQMTSLEYRQQEQAQEAKQWLADTIAELKKDKDLKGQPEENLWKKVLSEKWLRASEELKQPALELIKSKWQELGISWEQPTGNAAIEAKRNFTK